MRAAFLYSKGGIGKVDAIKKEQIEQEVKKLAPQKDGSLVLKLLP